MLRIPTLGRRGLVNGLMQAGGKLFDFYVDSVNGDDGNDGKSAITAYKTISALTGQITAGTRIGLARGSTWLEQLNLTENNVVVRAYGTGDAPLLDASNAAANASFAKTDGRTNVYEIAVSLAAQYSEQWCNAFEDGAFLVRAADVAGCDATAGSYFVTANYGDITLYIHASDSSAVTTNGKTYRYTARNSCINIESTGCELDGLYCRRNLMASGSIVTNNNNRVLNCTAADGNSHNIQTGEGCYLYNVTAHNAYNGASTSSMFNYYGTPAGLGVIYDHCTAKLDTASTLITAFYGHTSGTGSFGSVVYNNCTSTNCQIAFSGTGTDTVTIINATVTGASYAVRTDDAAPRIINGGTFACGRFLWFNGTDHTATVTGATAACTSTIGIYSTANNTTLTLTNCILSAAGAVVRTTNITGYVFTSNGTRYTCVTSHYYTPATFTYAGDNNIFVNGAVGTKFNINGTAENFAAWQARVTPHDANSTTPAA